MSRFNYENLRNTKIEAPHSITISEEKNRIVVKFRYILFGTPSTVITLWVDPMGFYSIVETGHCNHISSHYFDWVAAHNRCVEFIKTHGLIEEE